MQNAGSVSKNKEVPGLTSIILGIISAVLLLYAIVITVLFKRKTMQIGKFLFSWKYLSKAFNEGLPVER